MKPTLTADLVRDLMAEAINGPSSVNEIYALMIQDLEEQEEYFSAALSKVRDLKKRLLGEVPTLPSRY